MGVSFTSAWFICQHRFEKKKTSRLDEEWRSRWVESRREERSEVLEEKQLQRERDEARGEERRGGNPSGKQRVLSDRLGLCNRMGAF